MLYCNRTYNESSAIMLNLSSHIRAFSIIALICTLYMGVMTVGHEVSFDDDYHHEHQCEMFSGLQQGLVSDPILPSIILQLSPAFEQETPLFRSTNPANLRARSPPLFLS